VLASTVLTVTMFAIVSFLTGIVLSRWYDAPEAQG